MALSRLGVRGRTTDYTWPGFVDALASLLMVFVFVLMVFVLIQANLSYRVTGQDQSLSRLRAELSALTSLLNLERDASAELSAQLASTKNSLELMIAERDLLNTELAGLRAELSAGEAQIAALTGQVSERDVLLAELERLLAEANTQNDNLDARLQATQTALTENQAALKDNQDALRDNQAALALSEDKLAEAEADLLERAARLKLLEEALAKAEAEIEAESAKLASANNATLEARAEIDRLIAAATALRAELDEMQRLLAIADEKDKENRIAIANLGKKLNEALASKVQELNKFRSDFFGEVRQILEGQSGIEVVGDRFVFSSEVLFEPGAADINDRGRAELGKIADILMEVAMKIPEDIPWVLQIEGHTDAIPVSGRYTDNWDLSTERALSVVRFLIEEGLPANRLSATGYGEFQPIDKGETIAAYQRNRRIELKLTQRIVEEANDQP